MSAASDALPSWPQLASAGFPHGAGCGKKSAYSIFTATDSGGFCFSPLALSSFSEPLCSVPLSHHHFAVPNTW